VTKVTQTNSEKASIYNYTSFAAVFQIKNADSDYGIFYPVKIG